MTMPHSQPRVGPLGHLTPPEARPFGGLGFAGSTATGDHRVLDPDGSEKGPHRCAVVALVTVDGPNIGCCATVAGLDEPGVGHQPLVVEGHTNRVETVR